MSGAAGSSGAFDTIDHSILLKRLHDRALEWICSYLTACNQKVVVDAFESDPVALTFVIHVYI